MLRWSVLAVSLLVSLPTLWQGLVTQTIPVDTMIVRFLIAVPIVAVLMGFVRSAMRTQR